MLFEIDLKDFPYRNRETVSYTEFKVFQDCQFRHYMSFINPETPMGEKFQTFSGIFGTMVHEYLKKIAVKQRMLNLLNQRNLNIAFYQKEFKFDFLRELRKASVREDYATKRLLSSLSGKKNYTELKEIFIKAGQKFLNYGHFILTQNLIVATELELYDMIPDISPNLRKFKGAIDLVTYDNDSKKFGIIEWKTSYREVEHDPRQLLLYKYFLAKDLKLPLDRFKTYFCEFRVSTMDHKFTEVPSNSSYMENVMEPLKNFVLTLKTKKVSRKVGKRCDFCRFQDLCEMF